jgi:hypothetical protein
LTKEKLYQIYHLNNELEMWRDLLNRMENSELQGAQLTGMPRSGRISDITGNTAANVADVKRIINEIIAEIQATRKEIITYIKNLDDSLLRQIVFYRCVQLLKWHDVNAKIGLDRTDNTIKEIFYKHLEGEK